MNNYNSENYQDGEYEDKGDLVWDEFDWQDYLNRNKREIHKLLDVYKIARHDHQGYLEELAKFMGWTKIDSLDIDNFSTIEETVDESDDDDFEAEFEPYTVHKHPLYFLSTSLFQYIRNHWEEHLAKNSISTSSIASWRLATSLNEGQTNVLAAIFSLDVGDYALTICQLKHSLNAINECFRVIQSIDTPQVKEIQTALFNLREILLKVVKDCRDYDSAEFGDFE